MSTQSIQRALGIVVLIFGTSSALPLLGSSKTAPTKEQVTAQSPELAALIKQVISTEKQYSKRVVEFSPRVETYIQYYQTDTQLGDVARNDDIFLGRLRFGAKQEEASFIEDPSFSGWIHHNVRFRQHLRPENFASIAMMVDEDNFDEAHYTFDPVRWEYLGDLRCLALDVHPRNPVPVGAFLGRIWVEDHTYAIVRMNGTRVHPPRLNFYTHFDCWRENLQPGLWLPVYIYGQDSEPLRYRSETRLWGYDLSARTQQGEWTGIQIDAPAPVRDSSGHADDLSPLEGRRMLGMEAERNVLDRLEKARLIARPGPVDQVLETVVNNLRVTNHLDNMPPIQCRVMMTSTLESFSLTYTIVVSRGLIDVLPDEGSLAMIMAHEVAHIALGHKVDSKYAFNDRLEVSDEALLASLDLARNSADEAAAETKAIELLKNSPYKDNLTSAGLFLRAVAVAAPNTPHLFGAHLGNGLTTGHDNAVHLATLVNTAPALAPSSVTQIAALPLGSRVQVNAWDGSVAFTTRKALAPVDATEKMPFEVSPVIPYLKIYEQTAKTEVSARN